MNSKARIKGAASKIVGDGPRFRSNGNHDQEIPAQTTQRSSRWVPREEFLIPLSISQRRLAKESDVTEARISAICSGKCAITVDTALRLAALFGTTSGFWLGLKADYDIEEAAKELSGVLAQISPFELVAM